MDASHGIQLFVRDATGLTAMHTADKSPIRILSFSPALAGHFYRLNAEWLEQYFTLEPIDREVLGDPLKHIMDSGGDILFAKCDFDIVGTCALMPEKVGSGRFELTKMGVTLSAQGCGIGRRLMEAALARYHGLSGRELFLETSSRLTPAIRLYESVGFKHRPHPDGVSSYRRADVYMVYEPEGEQ